MSKIIIKNHNIEIEANPALSLLSIFVQNNAPIHTVCGGKGNCGCCRIKILKSSKNALSRITEQEKFRLGQELIDQGWRLSCQTYMLKDIEIFMPTDNDLELPCSNQKDI